MVDMNSNSCYTFQITIRNPFLAIQNEKNNVEEMTKERVERGITNLNFR